MPTPHTYKNNDLYTHSLDSVSTLQKGVKPLPEQSKEKGLVPKGGVTDHCSYMCVTNANNQVIISGEIFIKRWWLNVKECSSGVSIHACQGIS